MKKLIPIFLALFLIPTIALAQAQGLRHILCEKNEQGGWDCSIDQEHKIRIHGTEYSTGQRGKTFLQLLENEKPVNDADCYLTTYYPNAEKWLDDAPMLFKEEGMFYYNYFVPDRTGVYMVRVDCEYKTKGEDYFASDYKKVGVSKEEGSYLLTHKNDDDYHYFESPEADKVSVYYAFYNVSLVNITDINTYWTGHISKRLHFAVYDWNQDEWDGLPNSATETMGDTLVANRISEDVGNYIGNNTLRLGYKFKGEVWTDKLRVEAVGLKSEAINYIRGSEELHVTEPVSHEVWKRFYHLGTPPHMKSTQYYCVGNNTMRIVKDMEYCEGGECETLTLNHTKTCQYGCIEPEPGVAKCTKSPFTKNLVVLGVIVSIIAVIYIFTRWWY